MIIWLASYPKSGNTWIRSFLGSLLFNEQDEINFKSLSNMPQYPLRSHFNNLVNKNNIDDLNTVSSYWIKSQQIINSDKKVRFLKTHHIFCNINGSNFTDYNNSLGVIYIVRDPRNVISSIKYHYSKESYSEAKNILFDEQRLLGKKFDENSPKLNRDMLTLIASWKTHYNSWKNFKKNHLLIKYENLINEPKSEFGKIRHYLENKLGLRFSDKKFNNAIEANSFLKLKKIENSKGFTENISQKKGNFFNLGPENDYNKLLDAQIKKEIEFLFFNEMKELKYL